MFLINVVCDTWAGDANAVTIYKFACSPAMWRGARHARAALSSRDQLLSAISHPATLHHHAFEIQLGLGSPRCPPTRLTSSPTVICSRWATAGDVCVHVTSLNFTVNEIKIACFMVLLIADGATQCLQIKHLIAATMEQDWRFEWLVYTTHVPYAREYTFMIYLMFYYTIFSLI